MDSISEKAKLIAKQFRYSWSYLTFVLIFVLVLWTFQLALIVRFQTFWPSGGTICFTGEEDAIESRGIHQNSIRNLNYYSRYADPQFKIVCYYVLDTNITADHVKTLNINPFLCSHINVGFGKVVNGSIGPNQEDDFEAYKDLMNLKSINPHLKIMLSIQDNSSSPGDLPKVVSSDKLRKRFAENSVKFLTKYQFDGLDIDWEFPSWPTSDPLQKHNFTLLLKELHTSFSNSPSKLALSVAVGAPAAIFLQCYEIADMAMYVDWINLMSYDYHLYTKLTPTTGPNAPLYQRPQDSTFLATLNTNWSAAHWLFWGMPKEKIIIGIPTYGHSFKLLNPDNTGWYAPAANFGNLGEYGFTTYPDACSFIAQPSATHVWDDHYRVPYAYSGSEWISYEDRESIRHKAQLVIDGGYGGAMVFSLNTDDGKGLCRQGSFPLTSIIHSTLTQHITTQFLQRRK